MGKHRFRLSDMMPNAWFYKLRDMNNKTHHHHHPPLTNPTKKTQTLPPPPPSNPSNQQQKQQKQLGPLIPNRASYYFSSNSPLHPKAVDTTHFPPDSTSPTNSSSTPPRRHPRITKLPTTHHHHLPTTTTSPTLPLSTSSSVSESESDVIHSYRTCNTTTPLPPPKLDIVLDLRPILTKPPPPKSKPKPMTKTKIKKQDNINLKPSTAKSTGGYSATIQPRLLLRSTSSTRTPAGSPTRKVRVAVAAARRPSGLTRRRRSRGIDESFAVVKSSSDPRRDFRESMMEMILENKLTTSKDLEDLLACYLSLNSNQYHHVIVSVFEEIWFDITSFVISK